MARTEEPAASPGTIRCPSCGHANRPRRRFAAERGVGAGLGIVDAVGALNRRLQRRLAVRIGIDTGLEVIGDDGEVYGDPPNVAAQAQAVAEPDTVLVTAATHRLVSGRFIVEE